MSKCASIAACITAITVGIAASTASAQVIYEPVRVQFGGQNPYYYAGSDPYIHAAARYPEVRGTAFGRVGGYAFVSARRAVVERHTRIFTDAFGSYDARRLGMTVDDVVNEANARLPRYITKRDLLADAQTRATPRGLELRVAPDAGSPEARPRGYGSITIRPAATSPLGGRGRGPIFAIPRELMDQKPGTILIRPWQKA